MDSTSGDKVAEAEGQECHITLDKLKLGLKERWLSQIDGAQCTFGEQLPFPLIAEEVDGANRAWEFRKYRPHPDVALLKHGFPRFMAEVQSQDDLEHKYKLQIQMACVLRLALALRRDDGIKDNKFFLMGAFFTKQQEIYRIISFAGDDGKICFTEERLRMTNSNELTNFLHGFDNYVRHIKDEDTLGDKKQVIEDIDKEISRKYRKIFYTHKQSKERSSLETSRDGSEGQDSSSDKRAATEDALRMSGYKVIEPFFIDDGKGTWEPLIKLPDHIVEATTRNGEQVVAKLLRKKSELSILQELSSQKSLHNHVIPLLNTIPSSLGPVIILPNAASLSVLYFDSKLRAETIRLSHELIEGVAFLHRQKIAHMDIKPHNLVHKSKRLYIIDFDIAIRCNDVDEMVKRSVGTEGWNAPEVVLDDDMPIRPFNPIRADLWSCGKVLEYFARHGDKEDSDIAQAMKLLMENDPKRRPLLHEAVDEEPNFWSSGRFLPALYSQFHGDKFMPGDKVQKTTLEDGAKSKRARDDASHSDEEGCTAKVPRKDGDSNAQSDSSS